MLEMGEEDVSAWLKSNRLVPDKQLPKWAKVNGARLSQLSETSLQRDFEVNKAAAKEFLVQRDRLKENGYARPTAESTEHKHEAQQGTTIPPALLSVGFSAGVSTRTFSTDLAKSTVGSFQRVLVRLLAPLSSDDFELAHFLVMEHLSEMSQPPPIMHAHLEHQVLYTFLRRVEAKDAELPTATRVRIARDCALATQQAATLEWPHQPHVTSRHFALDSEWRCFLMLDLPDRNPTIATAEKSLVHHVGLVLWEIITGLPLTDQAQRTRALDALTLEGKVPKAFLNLVQTCLAAEEKRPAISEVCDTLNAMVTETPTRASDVVSISGPASSAQVQRPRRSKTNADVLSGRPGKDIQVEQIDRFKLTRLENMASAAPEESASLKKSSETALSYFQRQARKKETAEDVKSSSDQPRQRTARGAKSYMLNSPESSDLGPRVEESTAFSSAPPHLDTTRHDFF